MDMKFAACIQNKFLLGDFSGDDLTVGKLYEILSKEKHDMIRIVDDSGEDYLYPANCFIEIEVKPDEADRIHNALSLHAA